MNDLIFDQVFFSYEDKPVLQDVTMTFPAGQISILMGRSGIGKTTMFRLASGLLRPKKGHIWGIPEKGAGVLFQEDRLFPYYSIIENLKLCVPERSEEELMGMLEDLGLAQEAHSLPGALSGGMRRRVALIRAVAVDRDLYLLDEPFNGLDEETKIRTIQWLKEKLAGKTVVIITHQSADAQMLGGNILQFEEKGV